MDNKQNKQKVQTKPNKPYILAVGRRREAVARVRLYNPQSGRLTIKGVELGKGDILVNGKAVGEYFRFPAFISRYKRIFEDTNTASKFIFTVRVAGGGISGQLDAAVHGIARALDKLDANAYHKVLRTNGYLTRDPRVRERRKVGTGGKARRAKQSPKR